MRDRARAPARGQGKRDFVGESSNEEVNDSTIVIQRAWELSELVQVLENLAVSIELRSAESMPTPDEVAGAAVVIVSGSLPQRAAHRHDGHGGRRRYAPPPSVETLNSSRPPTSQDR